MRDAKVQVNNAAVRAGQALVHTDIAAPFHGVKVVFSGDHLQRMVAPPGVGTVGNDGVPHPYVPPATGPDVMWRVSDLKRVDTRVLVVVVHNNHRLQGMMHRMHETGYV